MLFSWDPRKERANQAKHGVSFREAEAVFLDPHALLMDDPDHSRAEARFVLLGLSNQLRALVVCHALPGEEDEIRLISCRRATRSEHRVYLNRRIR